MKRIFVILTLIYGVLSCQDEVDFFGVSIQHKDVSFKPIPGGAIMYYKLPSNPDVFSIRVKYHDAEGNEVVNIGSYASDSLELVGFNEAVKGVQAYISLCNNKNEESEAIEVTFDTEDSAPVAFFNNLTVSSHWNGFRVKYKSPEKVNGLAHIFYLGENPLTHKVDTLLLKSFPIAKGDNELFFPLQQKNVSNTVVVRTEDFRGYRVKQQIYENIAAFDMEQLKPTDFDFIDSENKSFESDEFKMGVKYLFDGDLKGEQFNNGYFANQFYTFLAGPNAVNIPFVIDMREAKVAAALRFYGVLNIGLWPGDWVPIVGEIWNGWYITKLPSEVTVYASNNKDDETSWKQIGHFLQGRSISLSERWHRRCNDMDFRLFNTDDLLAAEPCYMTVELPADAGEYRYLKIVVNEVFENTSADPTNPWYDQNVGKYVTFHELEVYTKKD